MGLLDLFKKSKAKTTSSPRAMAADGGTIINTPQELEAALRGSVSGSGAVVNVNTAMQVAAVYACIRIISGAVSNVPLNVKRRVDDRTREDATDTALWKLLRVRPNKHQTAYQFRRVMQVDVLSEHGNGYAHITWGLNGDPIQLIRLDPSRVVVKQNADLTKAFEYTAANGRRVTYKQEDILHLFGLSLDGIKGVGPIRYAREVIGDSLTLAQHGSTMFKNGARITGVLETDKVLGLEGIQNLKASLDTFRAGAENEGKDMILEDGLTYNTMALTSEDAQWMEARAFSRSDIAMFFGVPPHMIGVTEKTTSWGTGIEEQTIGFLTYTLEDHFTMWEDALDARLTDPDDDIFTRFNRSAIVRSDMSKRKEFYAMMLQWGVLSPNEVRALEDKNPREGGDDYYLPPNTAGDPDKTEKNK